MPYLPSSEAWIEYRLAPQPNSSAEFAMTLKSISIRFTGVHLSDDRLMLRTPHTDIQTWYPLPSGCQCVQLRKLSYRLDTMSLVRTLLQVIVGTDGKVLVIQSGDKPHLVTASGKVELVSNVLAVDTVSEIVDQLLPPELRQAFDDVGALEYEVPPLDEFPNEHFTVIVTRVGDDVRAEIHRRVADDDLVPGNSSRPRENVRYPSLRPRHRQNLATISPLPM